MKNFEITSRRLILSEINYDYKKDIFKEFTPNVAKYLVPQPSSNIKDTVKFITDGMENNRKGIDLELVILNKRNRNFIGCIGLHEINKNNPYLGIWLKESAWGYGYAKEALSTLINWAKLNFMFREIIYSVFEDNIPSIKIIENLGAEKISEIGKKNNAKESHLSLKYRIIMTKN